jgi:phage tail-like protein
MSAPVRRAYRFATRAQWASGLFSRARFDEHEAVLPYPPHAPGARAFAIAGGGWAPACGHDGSAWWRSAQGTLYSLDAGADAPHAFDAAGALAGAARLVIGRRVVWAAAAGARTLSCYARDDLGHLRSVAVAGAVIDMAGAGRDGVWVLAARRGEHWLLHIDCAGRQLAERRLPADMGEPQALVYLRDMRQFLLLARHGELLWFLDADGDTARPPLAVASMSSAFRATQLGSDGHGTLVLGGSIGSSSASAQWRVVVADATGNVLEQIAIAAPVTGVSAHRGLLLVGTANGVECYRAGDGDVAAAAACLAFITPPLYSPESGVARGWLRAELTARLPRGALLTIDWAATDQETVRDDALDIAQNGDLPPQLRQAQLAQKLGTWSTPLLFAGSGDGAEPQSVSVPLFGVRARWLWLRVRLSAPSGATLPRLSELCVLYPDLSLMQQLPAIFRRDDDPHDFLRAFVGVLETTTQDLDRKIASLGSLLDPHTAGGEWLDYTARWLGLPWDDALDIERKRRLLLAGHRILALRGTRAGLEALLASLFPKQSPRWRVRDVTVESAPMRLGGRGRAGTALPALLAGLPKSAAVPGRRLILGQARLPCKNAPPETIMPWVGLVRIDIFASAQERAELERWLPALVDAVMPLTARAALRWRQGPGGVVPGEELILSGTGKTRLGGDAILGDTRLTAERPMTLSGPGIGFGFDLQ